MHTREVLEEGKKSEDALLKKLQEHIRSHLRLSVEQSTGFYGEKYCSIQLIHDESVISEEFIDLG